MQIQTMSNHGYEKIYLDNFFEKGKQVWNQPLMLGYT
jgi:hypothetical protein